jgi:ABC-type antimicrobial peptide transport system permease subunit
VLGIIIGVGAVICVVAIGEGAQASVERAITNKEDQAGGVVWRLNREGAMNREVIVLEHEVNRTMSAALNARLDVNDRAFAKADMIANPDELQRVLKALRARDFTIASIRKRPIGEHPESMFVGVWKPGAALELAKGLRFVLDVQSGVAMVASNSGRPQ